MTSNYSDPFANRSDDNPYLNVNSGSNLDSNSLSFPRPDVPSTTSTTARVSQEGDLVSTAQNDYLQRRESVGSRLSRALSVNSRAPSQSANTYLGTGASGYPSDANQSRLSYISEEDDVYKNKGLNDAQHASLVQNAASPGKTVGFQDLEYAEPFSPNANRSTTEKSNAFTKFLASGRYPLEQRIENKRRGIGRQRYPFVVWGLTVAMVGVFIYELVKNAREQGSPISLKPFVNPMLGPSATSLINVGARFPPCMKLVDAVPPTMQMGCMNNTANPPDRLCSVEEICGFGGFHGEAPNQWFRFITPIFLHAGIIHILLNMFAQWTISAQIEREMGSGGFFIMYFAAGIFGNVLGGNFSLVGQPSVGASGAIFGTVAVTWVDLFAHWKYHYRPVRRLIFQTIELLIGIAIGYIPYVDNFAHIGGFVMGLLTGMVFYPVISTTKRHRAITWTFRIAAIPLAIIFYVVLIRNFYTSDPYAACSGCRYLSCFPTDANNHCKGTGLTTFTTQSTAP